MRLIGKLSFTIASCCLSVFVSAATVDVKSTGAIGNGVADDLPAIQEAIAKAALSSPAVVVFPHGRYRVTQAIRPEVDGITLVGKRGATVIADPDLHLPFPEAIFVHRGFPQLPPQPVNQITIKDLSIEVLSGFSGDVSTGAVQLNNATNCLVDHVRVTYTGRVPKPDQIDGIVAALGTSGVIKHCVVDGIPKGCFYASTGSHDLEFDDCEARNAGGPFTDPDPPGFGGTGWQITGCTHVRLVSCSAHDNENDGILIGVGGPAGEIPPTPAVDVQLKNCGVVNNGGMGILCASQWDGVIASNVRLDNLVAANNYVGILIQAGSGISVNGGTVFGSDNAGIWVDNIPIGPSPIRTGQIAINNVLIADNGANIGVDIPGIVLHAARDVSIIGGVIARTNTLLYRQRYGVALYANYPTFAASQNIKIIGVNMLTGLDKPIATLDLLTNAVDPNAAATSGFYDIAFFGDPEGFVPAPPLSLYRNVITTNKFIKMSGTGPAGWVPKP